MCIRTGLYSWLMKGQYESESLFDLSEVWTDEDVEDADEEGAEVPVSVWWVDEGYG
jgi:hypothetical protein